MQRKHSESLPNELYRLFNCLVGIPFIEFVLPISSILGLTSGFGFNYSFIISALGATQTTVSSPTGRPNVTSLPEI